MTATPSRAAVFLDRDGTLTEDRRYVSRARDVVLLPGTGDALRTLAQTGALLIVITNQSGIGRGYFAADDYRATTAELTRQVAAAGAGVDAVYHCPHAPDAGCLCRKPGTALHREAAAAWNIDLLRSWCVGDQWSDVLPARELGCRGVRLAGDLDATDPLAAADDFPVMADLGSAAALMARYL